MNDGLATAPPRSRERLGRYYILEELARGGMAQVFIAQKAGASEICVLKQLLVELETHETAGKRFYREAHVASYLNHPNIARVTDAGVEGKAFCIAMEFIAGKDVEAMMHKLMGQGLMLPHEVSMAVALGALEGLTYAHDARDADGRPFELVHRNLSPRNIMLSYSGEVKIIDFGLAHGNVDDFKTSPGMILGTLRYMSPEQALSSPVDRRSDLYSLAVVLYEMLTGRFMIQHGKPVDVLMHVTGTVPAPVTTLNPNLPPALNAVLAKALEKRPEDRYQTAAELRKALVEAAGRLAQTPQESLGEFVSHLFPEDRKKSTALIELGRARHKHNDRTPAGGIKLEFSETLDRVPRPEDPVRPQPITGPSDVMGATRTGMVSPSDLRGPADLMITTRTGLMVQPVPLSGPDLANPTRTALTNMEDDDHTAVTGLPEPLLGEPTEVVRRRADGMRGDLGAVLMPGTDGMLDVAPTAIVERQRSSILEPAARLFEERAGSLMTSPPAARRSSRNPVVIAVAVTAVVCVTGTALAVMALMSTNRDDDAVAAHAAPQSPRGPTVVAQPGVPTASARTPEIEAPAERAPEPPTAAVPAPRPSSAHPPRTKAATREHAASAPGREAVADPKDVWRSRISNLRGKLNALGSESDPSTYLGLRDDIMSFVQAHNPAVADDRAFRSKSNRIERLAPEQMPGALREILNDLDNRAP